MFFWEIRLTSKYSGSKNFSFVTDEETYNGLKKLIFLLGLRFNLAHLTDKERNILRFIFITFFLWENLFYVLTFVYFPYYSKSITRYYVNTKMPKSNVRSLKTKKWRYFGSHEMIYCWLFKIKIVYTTNIRQNPNSRVIKCIFFSLYRTTTW